VNGHAAGYREHSPSPALRPFVECYWTHSAPAAAGEAVRILPDGCCDLLFDGATGEARLIGAMTAAQTFTVDAPIDLFAVRFRPGGLHRLVRASLAQFTDREERLLDVIGDWREPAERALSRDGRADRIRILDAELLRRLAAAPRDGIDHAIDQLADRRGNLRIDDLADQVGISRQWFARGVLARCGVGPRLLGRILRFRAAAAELAAGDRPAAVAARCGYADQAHLCRDVREFAGTTPTSLRAPRPAPASELPFVQD
jgi:AraC-like DNA-binding protein